MNQTQARAGQYFIVRVRIVCVESRLRSFTENVRVLRKIYLTQCHRNMLENKNETCWNIYDILIIRYLEFLSSHRIACRRFTASIIYPIFTSLNSIISTFVDRIFSIETHLTMDAKIFLFKCKRCLFRIYLMRYISRMYVAHCCVYLSLCMYVCICVFCNSVCLCARVHM